MRPDCTFPRCDCRGWCKLSVTEQMPRALAAGDRCPYCGKTMTFGIWLLAPTREHVRPRTRGGKLTPDNRLIVCRRCNEDKGSRTLAQFAAWLCRRADPRYARVTALLRSRKAG